FRRARGVTVDVDHQVLRFDPGARGGAAFDDLDNLDPGVPVQLACKPRRQRARAGRNAEISATHSARADQLGDDATRVVVDRDREPEALAHAGADHRGVDPDEPPSRVDERATRVPGVYRRVGLYDVLDEARHGTVTRRERSS